VSRVDSQSGWDIPEQVFQPGDQPKEKTIYTYIAIFNSTEGKVEQAINKQTWALLQKNQDKCFDLTVKVDFVMYTRISTGYLMTDCK